MRIKLLDPHNAFLNGAVNAGQVFTVVEPHMAEKNRNTNCRKHSKINKRSCGAWWVEAPHSKNKEHLYIPYCCGKVVDLVKELKDA